MSASIDIGIPAEQRQQIADGKCLRETVQAAVDHERLRPLSVQRLRLRFACEGVQFDERRLRFLSFTQFEVHQDPQGRSSAVLKFVNRFRRRENSVLQFRKSSGLNGGVQQIEDG